LECVLFVGVKANCLEPQLRSGNAALQLVAPGDHYLVVTGAALQVLPCGGELVAQSRLLFWA
jgi:hypothetical protein